MTEPWCPDPDDVASLISRLAVAPDGTTGTFTDTSTPTWNQVASVIDGIAGEVTNSVGSDLTATWEQAPTSPGAYAARRVVALGAAAEIALSFYPSSGAQDLAERLDARYTAALARLEAGGAADPETGGSTGGGVERPATPVGGYPPPYGQAWPTQGAGVFIPLPPWPTPGEYPTRPYGQPEWTRW